MIPRSSRLLFEQEVLPRPSARFETAGRILHCLGDALVPSDGSRESAIILEGTPPFVLKLTVNNLAASEVSKHTVEVRGKVWKVDLPEYQFKTIGPHRITIDSVQDASHCEQVALEASYQSIMVDIVESAAIVPFDRKEHYCVGEVSQFQLEGIPPWTIGYGALY
jgi:nucleoporin POM152